MDQQKRNIAVIAGLLVTVLLMDAFYFRYLIWKIPNESPWNTNQFYNALYEIKKPRSGKKRRILVIGSSIAYYSFNAGRLGALLRERTGEEFEIVFLAFAGMTPFDADMMTDTIIDLHPDLVLYPVNFIDFRLHRPYVMGRGETNETVDDKTMLVEDSLNLAEAPQSAYMYPGRVLQKYSTYISPEKAAVYLSSLLFGFYRYRDVFLQHFAELAQHHFGRNTSYHGYMGVQIPERVTARGWTGKKFSFIPTGKMAAKGIWVEIVPELVDQGPLEVTLASGGTIEKIYYKNPGWKQIHSDLFKKRTIVTVELSETWEPFEARDFRFDYLHDRLGVRLQQTFGLEEIPAGRYFQREERLEDLRFMGMSDEAYKKYFYEYLLKDPEKRPGISYLNALKIAKNAVAGEGFRQTFQFGRLQHLNQALGSEHIKLVIINHPENPVSLSWYGRGEWYKGYLDFLNSLEIVNTTKLIDLKDSLEMKDFNDFHHITYGASLKLVPVLGDIIIKNL